MRKRIESQFQRLKMNKPFEVKKIGDKFRAKINRALGNPMSRKKKLETLLKITTIATIGVCIVTCIYFKEPILNKLVLYISKLKARIYKSKSHEVLSSSNSDMINNVGSSRKKSMMTIVVIYSIGVAAAILDAYLSKDSTPELIPDSSPGGYRTYFSELIQGIVSVMISNSDI